MKKHLLIITAIVLLPSCRSMKETITDTVYISKHHYDSILINRCISSEVKGDTVFIDRLKSEVRYRLHTDTIYLHHTDTVITTKEASYYNTPPYSPSWCMLLIKIVVCIIILRKFYSFKRT